MTKTILSLALLCATISCQAAPTLDAPVFEGPVDPVIKEDPEANAPLHEPTVIPNYGGDPVVIEDVRAYGALAAAAVSGTTDFLVSVERRAVRKDGITVEGNAGTSEIAGVDIKSRSLTISSRTSLSSRGDWSFGTALSARDGEIDRPDSSASDSSDSSDFDALTGGAFVRWSDGLVNVIGAIAYGKYDLHFETTMPDVSTDVLAGSVTVSLSSMYRLLSVEPYVGIRSMRIDDNAAEGKADVHQIPIGIRIATEMTVNDWTLAGRFDASYVYGFGDDTLRIDLAETDAFVGTHAAKAVIGLSAQYKEAFRVDVSYGYAAGDKDFEEHLAQMEASLLF